ncbi:MAG: hypothetical protein KGJ52_07870, partial [Gammaproteobacteria bacterium]|nr:hypothetical protein [Gammaproteobacteria bacterium]
DFALAKCNADGTFEFDNIPTGDFKITVFDQWNDLMLDGLVSPVKVAAGTTTVNFPVTQWRTNLYTRSFLDTNGDGVSQAAEPGLPLVATNIRYRDGSYGFFNNTDLNGYAGFNEVFPFMNWLVVEADTTRYKVTGVHTVNDAGGLNDRATSTCVTDGSCGDSDIAANTAATRERNSLPLALRVPGAVYCDNADCAGFSIANGPYYNGTSGAGVTGLSTARIDPPGTTTEGWQGLLGLNDYAEFAMKPFLPNENGGIKGHVIYASTRPFDDPALLLQLSWEPGVPRVKVNLYQEVTAPDGTSGLKLVDRTTTSSWDDFAQGFRSDGVPNMNCPGQDPASPFFATLKDSTQWLDPNRTALPNNAQFKCYDGWSMLNQIQPAPYDGMYRFPSVTARDPVSGRPAGTNCSICGANPDDGNPMLPAGKYVVEVIVPPGFELVKEEDKNIFLGDTYIAPVSQQFPAGFGNVFIMPDQAAVNAYYNQNNGLNATTNLGATPRHEGDTGSIESFWPCVGAARIVPDYNSLFPTAGQNAPFAGATRHLCDRKAVILENQATALVKFYVFTSAHIAGHFTGTITNDFASEFDPFSPQFGEKFGPPNLPVGIRDYTGKEIARVYSDQWGLYNGLNYSSYAVNPPNPTGYIPTMMIACMNDPGPVADAAHPGQTVTDPNYNPAYSNFCYEQPFMPGFTTYMDTPVVPTQAFAEGYNLPDAEYPDGTPAIRQVVNADPNAVQGPWVSATGPVSAVQLTNGGANYTSVPTVDFTPPAGASGAGAGALALMGVGSVSVANSPNGSYRNVATPTVIFDAPPCVINTTTCVRATGSAQMSSNNPTNQNRRVTGIDMSNRGSGYTAAPGISFSTGPATATARLTVRAVALQSGGAGYDAAPLVSFAGGGGSGAAASASLSLGASGSLIITALGDKVVQNPAFSGPNAATAPFNLKTIMRHYGFGAAQGTGTVTIGGLNAPVSAWSDTAITVTVPPALPACALAQRGVAAGAALCGQLVITADTGKRSIDAITVTAGGSKPIYVAGQDLTGHAIQHAIDAAKPGDLIIVGPGTYKENLLMWKPVRLQGVGSGAVTINADAHPAGKMDAWRRQVNCLFGLTIDGVPNLNNAQFDAKTGFVCPDDMYLRVDRIPFEGFVGWDASSNGNLAQVLQEPTLMGAYEGAGVTVLGRGVRVPNGSTDLWGQATPGVAGAFPDGSRYLDGRNTDCNSSTTARTMYDYGTSNFHCNPSRIDGLSIINSSQGGGGIFIHGWNHNLDVANNRLSANHGTLSGGINLGNGETPPAYINDGTICGPGVPTPAPLCPPLSGTPANGAIPFQLNVGVHVHHNDIYNNASLGDALFSGTPSGGGGLTVSAGADNYEIDHNWIAGNLSTGDGGGMEHLGLSVNGRIHNNWILFNQSVNPTLPTNGGGL